ncbi:FAD-binding dehydrogenase [Arthrobacter psychrolactophilus]|uniref:FAD-binding dehydrogenase n=1 Tax=Arthrobacter psychrolactophilus TaxID=92442 RepID=A0A2V5IUW3_9MICC|nr:FAD-binding dehydrogenase [Arthrobacter psychrolactophilus]PYI37934.1 FAD-binding dehydrogenase [Arthrobacter psychrolactophilus]
MESKHGAVWQNADVIVVGAGLSGLVSAAEAYNAGRRVLILDQEPEASLGGQAHWSFGGLFLVDSPEQRHLGVKDSAELALSDWLGSAAFDRPEDLWARRWAEAYVNFAAGEKRAWLHALGVRFFPLVQWAERGGYDAQGHGNSVPRFHVVWGTGPGILAPFLSKLEEGVAAGQVQFAFRHRAIELMLDGGTVTGVRGQRLAASAVERGQESSREVTGEFSVEAGAVIVTTGGIGGNHPMVRDQWPNGSGPEHMLTGVPASVDGHFQQAVARVGGALINTDRMWHYPEGIHNPDPVWPNHGIRILSGPSPLWLDATGHRLPVPLFPGFDSLGTLRHLETTGHGHSWFVLNKSIIAKEFALSGSEQNPDLTGKDVKLLAKRALPGVAGPVQKILDAGIDFVQADTAQELAGKMNALVHSELIDPEALHETLMARDRQVTSGLGKDTQINAIREARRFTTDKLMRVVPPHAMLAAEHGPLIAVRLTTLTRKSLGGLTTDLNARVLDAAGSPIPGLYAAGEAAGFGGGGMHGYRSLEGTFLGGCLFSGRTAGRHAAETTQA